MANLSLTLHKKWFDRIAAGRKTHEFREAKPYWAKRLDGRQYSEIHFRNGYSKDAPFMRVEFLGCRLRGCLYVIKLGRVLEVRR